MRVRSALSALVLAAALGPAASAAAAAGWTPPFDLQPLSTGTSNTAVSVAAAPDGTTAAVWSTPGKDATGSPITVSHLAVRAPGADDPVTVAAPSGLGPIGIAADGTVVGLVTTAEGLRVVTRAPGGSFAVTATLSTSSQVSGARIAVDADGEAIAGWYETTNQTTKVPLAAVLSGGTWGAAQTLGGATGFPTLAVAIGAGGRAVVAASADGAAGPVAVALREPGAGLSPSAPLPGVTSAFVQGVSAAVAPSGQVAIGASLSGSSGGLVSVAPPGQGPATAQPLATTISVTVSALAVTAGPGGVLAAYIETGNQDSTGNSPTTVKVADLDPVTAAPSPALSISPAGQSIGNALVAVADATGATAVVYGNRTAATLDVVRRSAAGADFSAPAGLGATDGDGAPYAAAVAPSGTGDLATVTVRPGGSVTTQHPVLAAYDVTPPSLGAVGSPTTAPLGAPVAFTLGGVSDAWSTPSVAWGFGDGTNAAGPDVTHAYGTAGQFSAVLVASDGVGNLAQAARTVAVPTAPLVDADGDGVPAGRDCNDHDAKIKPGAQEIVGNRVDENCDGRATAYTSISLGAVLTWDRLRSGRTRITGLTVSNVRRGDKVSLTCTGHGCPKKGATKKLTLGKVNGKRISLTRYAKRTLSAKARLILTVTRSGATTRRIRFTMVKRRNPTRSTRCLTPGATKERIC